MSVSRGAGASARRRMLRIGLAVVGCLFCVLVLWLWGSDEPDQALLVPWGTPTGSGVLEGRF